MNLAIKQEDLIKQERNINFEVCLRSKSDNFRKLEKKSYDQLFAFISAQLDNYCKGLGQNANHLLIWINDTIETRPDWKPEDVVNFFKFIRQRQDIQELKIYGKLTTIDLTRFVAVYEDYKAQERERLLQHKKSSRTAGNKERINAVQPLKKQISQTIPDERYFEL